MTSGLKVRGRFMTAGVFSAMCVAMAVGAGACSDSGSSASTGTGGSIGTGGSTGTGGVTGTGGSTGTGGAGGAPTLYTKYGAAIPKVVNDAVTGLLADSEIAPYFASVGMPGHDSVARLKSCLRLQFTALFGGPATYPGVNDNGDTCVDMVTIHAGLNITSAAFDKFVMDLGAVLKADGVTDADVTTIAGAVAGLKPDIVTSTN